MKNPQDSQINAFTKLMKRIIQKASAKEFAEKFRTRMYKNLTDYHFKLLNEPVDHYGFIKKLKKSNTREM